MGSVCEQRIDLSLKFSDKKLLLRHRRQLCNKNIVTYLKRCLVVGYVVGLICVVQRLVLSI